jgi:hypothetical protein
MRPSFMRTLLGERIAEPLRAAALDLPAREHGWMALPISATAVRRSGRTSLVTGSTSSSTTLQPQA